MVECENCGARYYRYYKDDERTDPIDTPCMLYIHYNDTWLCVFCGRELDHETKAVIREGDPKWKDHVKKALES